MGIFSENSFIDILYWVVILLSMISVAYVTYYFTQKSTPPPPPPPPAPIQPEHHDPQETSNKSMPMEINAK